MSVKIFIRRKIAEDHIFELTVLLKKLRGMTLNQPGYISGETLRRIDKPGESMVISIWHSIEDWNSWVNDEQRMAIQSEIDRMLDGETEYAIYG